MQFPGKSKLVLSDEAVKKAIEDAINVARRDGEDYVYVTDIQHRWADETTVCITTDRPEPAKVVTPWDKPETEQVAA